MKNLKKISILALGAMVLFSACKKEEVTPEDPAKGEQSFKVRMTDNPGNYDKLDVEITSIAVLNSNNEWVTLNADAQTVSVLELTNGEEKEIAAKNDVDAGVYSKLKLEFSPNSQLTLNSFLSTGPLLTKVDLNFTTAGSSKTVIVEIDEEVSANSNANILIDFNVAQSIVDSANTYFLNPHITVIADEKTGVQGHTKNEIRAAIMLENEANENYKYSGYTNQNGEFLIRGMVDGTYTMTVMPDQDEDPSLNSSYTFTSVVIVDGEIKQMGEIELQ